MRHDNLTTGKSAGAGLANAIRDGRLTGPGGRRTKRGPLGHCARCGEAIEYCECAEGPQRPAAIEYDPAAEVLGYQTEPARSPDAASVVQAGSLRLVLPWPPTINHYWRRHGHVIHVSTAGTAFARRCKEAVLRQWDAAPIDVRVAVLIEAWAATRRSWDVDNRVKPLLDALTRAGLWVDDSVVRDLRIVDRGVFKYGKIVMWVRPMGESR